MIIQTLVYIYGFILLMSSIFTFFLYISYRERLLKQLLYFWISGLFSFILQGAFNKEDMFGFLSFASHAVSIYFLLQIYYGLAENRLPIKSYAAILFTGVALSITAFSFDLDFAVSSAFFCLSVVIIFAKSIIYNMRFKSSHPLFKGLSLLLFLNALHFANYPIIRPNPNLAILGFSVALGFYFIYSIYIPLFVIKKTSDNYSIALENKVQKRTSELEAANEELSLKNNELMVLNQAMQVITKENQMLLNILVHDISNPVQVFVGFVDKINKAETQVISKTWNDRVRSALGAMLDTLATVKSYHSVRVGKILPKLTKFDVTEVVQSTLDQFDEKLKAKNLNLEVKVQPNIKTELESDRSWIKNQIFSNIISNAIKFSFANAKIAVEISSVKEGLIINFRDYGTGIPEEVKSKIFSSLTPTTTLGTNGEKGTGLGMPIVKDYIIRLKGTIEIANLPLGEAGTCFQIYLPYEFREKDSQVAS